MDLQQKVISILSATNTQGRLQARERGDLELKKSFNAGSFSTYAKTMAGYANKSGGFIIFGVSDKPRQLIGITDKMDNFPQEKFSECLSNLYAPEILWEMGVITLNELNFGYFYTFESDNKPIMALKNDNSSNISPGDIIYRFNSRTQKIKYSELKRLFDDKIEKERRLFMEYLAHITRIGATNVGLIDYTTGDMSTPNGVNIVVDKKIIVPILKKARFIKSGSFEEGGQPVLQITGNVEIAEAVPVPGTNPNDSHPYRATDLAMKLFNKKTTFEVQALVWKFELKDKDQYHLELKAGKTHTYSEATFLFLKQKIEESNNQEEFIKRIKKEYSERTNTAS